MSQRFCQSPAMENDGNKKKVSSFNTTDTSTVCLYHGRYCRLIEYSIINADSPPTPVSRLQIIGYYK
jgi:hypothetical protein